MGCIIIILLALWFLGAIFSDDHCHCSTCHRRRDGFFFHRGCDYCPDHYGSGCLSWIIGAIILWAIFGG